MLFTRFFLYFIASPYKAACCQICKRFNARFKIMSITGILDAPFKMIVGKLLYNAVAVFDLPDFFLR